MLTLPSDPWGKWLPSLEEISFGVTQIPEKDWILSFFFCVFC